MESKSNVDNGDDQAKEHENAKEEVKKIIVEVCKLMDQPVEPTIRETLSDNNDEPECTFVIRSEENAQSLIGHHGANLQSLEHLIHLIARSKNLNFHFKIDINDYREGKKEIIEKIAKDAVATVKASKESVILNPMNPYERRIVHTIVAGYDQVSTDSIGEGADRKVVVKPG